MFRFTAALSRAATPTWGQHLPTAVAASSQVNASYHSSAPVAARLGARAMKKKNKNVVMSGDAEWSVDTSFMTDDFQSKAYARGGTVKAVDQFQPYQPDNWEELLARAAAAYPERAGPRRNRAAERQKNRRHEIFAGHQVMKKQRFAAHVRKQAKIKAEIDGMRAAWLKYGYPPAVEYATAVGSAATAGLGGRLGNRYFGPLFRDGTFDASREPKEAWDGKKRSWVDRSSGAASDPLS